MQCQQITFKLEGKETFKRGLWAITVIYVVAMGKKLNFRVHQIATMRLHET